MFFLSSVRYGPVTWLIVAEIFPLEVRGKVLPLGIHGLTVPLVALISLYSAPHNATTHLCEASRVTLPSTNDF